jgi:hypothetical protein
VDVLTGTGGAATFTGAFTGAGVYTAQVMAEGGNCAAVMTGTHFIAAYPAILPGAITSAATTTEAGTDPNVTIANATPASGGSDNLTYLWQRTGTGSATLTGTGTTYALSSDATGNYATAGTYYFNRYAQDATCTNIAPVADAGTYTLYVESDGPPGTVSVTLCTQCCYNGSAWVDCYVTTNAVSNSAQWSGYTKYYPSSRSDKNGRVYFEVIIADTANYTNNSAVGLCKALGTGWYLPAYEELYAMSSGEANSASNDREGAGILEPDESYWSMTQYYGNGGRYNRGIYEDHWRAVTVSGNGTLAAHEKLLLKATVCAWRD